MSSYETLLETYAEEEKFSQITFDEMHTMIESLTEFVNEEVQFTVEISLQEAENDSIKNKAILVSAGIKQAIKNLIKKLGEFITKIAAAVKAFVAKANQVIKTKGNAALAKMISNNEHEVKKDIKLVAPKNGYTGVTGLFSAAEKEATEVSKLIKKININDVPVEVPEVPESIKGAIDTFKENFAKSSMVEDKPIAKGTKVSKAYEDEVEPWISAVDNGTKKVQNACNSAMKDAKDLIAKLNKLENTEKPVKADAIGRISKISAALMQMSTASVRYGNTVLTIATKNAAKLALAGAASAAKDKKEELKASAAARKAEKAQAKADKKLGMGGKKAGSIQKQED